jgi:hypothetical protein
MAVCAEIGVLGQVKAALSNTPTRRWALKSIRLLPVWRGTNASGFYAAALGLPRNMTIPSHMNHTI